MATETPEPEARTPSFAARSIKAFDEQVIRAETAEAKLAQAEARIKELEAAQGHGCGGHFTYD